MYKYEYILKSPEGKKYKTTSLRAFCIEHNLVYVTMLKKAEHKDTTPVTVKSASRGWVVVKVTYIPPKNPKYEPESECPTYYFFRWVLRDPSGVVHETNEFRAFCKEHGLGRAFALRAKSYNKRSDVVLRGPCKGWSVVLAEKKNQDHEAE